MVKNAHVGRGLPGGLWEAIGRTHARHCNGRRRTDLPMQGCWLVKRTEKGPRKK